MERTVKILCAVLLLLYGLPVFAGRNLKITALQESKDGGGKYDIVLNNAVAVKNIALKIKNGAKEAEFPIYCSKGKIYRQFSVLKRDYRNYIADSLFLKKAEAFEGGTNFRINKFSLNKKEGSIKAFASVIFEELLEVECRIMEGKRGLWTAWPANNTSGGWKAEFVFEDKKLKKKVEESLTEKYKNFKNERK